MSAGGDSKGPVVRAPGEAGPPAQGDGPNPRARGRATLPLSLAIYIPNFNGGGVERISLMLIDAFTAQGIDVCVVVHMPSGDLRSLLPPNARLVSLDARRSLTALPKLVAFLRRESPDILLSSLGHNNIIALWARMLASVGSACSTRVVVCQHNALSSEAESMARWQFRVLPRLYRWFGRRADAIVGVSHGVSADLSRTAGIPLDVITTIHNPVLDRRFELGVQQPSTHPWLRDPELRVVIGIGRLVPQKDFGTLIAAFAELRRPETRLLILGDGPERERLQRLVATLGVADRVDLVGFELNPLPSLRDASVMVLSSIYEGFGNVLVEALGAGVPVVSTRCPYGPDEILDQGRFGDLVEVGDAQALARAIARQLDKPHPRRELRQARARDFHVDIVSRHYLALFDRVIGGGPRGNVAAASRPPGAPRPSGSMLERGLFVYLPSLRLGGGELSLVRLAGGFAQAGVRVTLVVHDASQRQIEVPPGVELVELHAQRSLSAVSRLARLLRARRPGAMLTAFPHSNVVAVVSRLLAGIDCQLVLSEHAPFSLQIELVGGWRFRLLPPFARWAYPRADAVVAVSRGVRDDLRAMMGRRLAPTVIHNPILGADWEARASESTAHAWCEDPSLQVVLSVSRLSQEKDIPTLVSAFAAVAATRPHARLLIAGEGPDRGVIEACIRQCGLADRAQLVGLVRNPLAWMRRARVFVLASHYEGFGNVLVEALAAGAQVVSTDCPVGPREVLQDGRLGRLVPVGDVSAMSKAIAAALDDEPAPGERWAAQEVARLYTQERACSTYLDLFADIEARRAAGRRGALRRRSNAAA